MASILCIDDQKRDLEIHRNLLEQAGHDVTTASSVREGVELVRNGNFDGVLLDFRMPGEDAERGAIQIRKHRPELPIVLLTAYRQWVPAHLERAVDAFLGKEQPHQEWLEAIERLFGPPQQPAAT